MNSINNSKKRILVILFTLLLFASIMYPDSLRVMSVKPDLILVLVILCALNFENKTIIFVTLICAVIRDLIEFRFPGPYIFAYTIIVILIYFAGSFFYRPGIVVNLLFIAIFTVFHDVLWVFLYNIYYLLKFNIGTNFAIGYNIANGSIYQAVQNIVFGSIMYFLIIFIKKRVLHEKT